MTATELKTRILAILDEVAAGEDVSITKHGRVVARLIPARGSSRTRGLLAGIAMTNTDEEGLFGIDDDWAME